jgi:hypothetical protein
MDIFPSDISKIIESYKIEFERVDNEISEAVNQFFCISHRVEILKCDLDQLSLCPCRVATMRYSLDSVLKESERLLETILTNQEVNQVQQEVFKHLSKLLVRMMATYFHPIILGLYRV